MTDGRISAEDLYRRPMRMGRDVSHPSEASFFPFFDAAGEVQWLMLTLPGDAEIYFVRPQAVAVGSQTAEPVLLEKEPTSWTDLTAEARVEIGDLWHFDPWWALTAPRYADHPALAALKATNCVAQLDLPASDVQFSRDLDRLVAPRDVRLEAQRHTEQGS
jgi:hypothetical protein